MFTGIVQQLGTVRSVNGRDPLRLEIELAEEIPGLAVGESLSMDGVCLTVTSAQGRRVTFDVSHESVQRTTLGDARPGSRINVERALTASSLLGGHLVQGHVDGLESCASIVLSRAVFMSRSRPPPNCFDIWSRSAPFA